MTENAVLNEEDRPWRWRNARAFSLQVGLYWPPRFTVQQDTDTYRASFAIAIGVVCLLAEADIGNSSSERWWERIGALSESEAWERAAR